MMRIGHRGLSRSAVACAAALAIGLAACGGDDSDSTGTDTTSEAAVAPESVTLTADEFTFDLSATPGPETKTVEFVNDGEQPHVLVFARINEGYTVDEAFELEGKKGSAELVGQGEAGPGETKTVKVKGPLEAGSYAMLCPLMEGDEPHYKLGQLQEFELE